MSTNKQALAIFENDKLNHVLYGAVAGGLGIAMTGSMTGGLFVSALVAGGVEIYDYVTGRGTSSFLDFLATISIPALLFAVELLIK